MSKSPDETSYRLRRPGGEINRGKIFNAPGVVMALAIATASIAVFMAFAPDKLARQIELAGAVIPLRFAAGLEGNVGALSMLSPLIGHMFLHGGIAHLGFNLLWLLAFGTPVARRMGADGALQSTGAFAASGMFLTFYFLCGAAGALLFIATHADQYTLLVGASGGVSGVLGALVRFAFNRSTLFSPEEGRISPLLSAPVATWTIFIVLLNNPLAAALMSPMAGGAQIAWEAHLGGYFFGLLAFPLFDRISHGFRRQAP